ncbi:hypothetical protein QF030_000471 [Streptomyces rishiriensis]|uniref:Transposase n=1 Tax=Streptomyces rishiriensis TaxID=68264 RepID=A0ABU0NHJ9_STRRH|nr:hypothetical protein [Streptomyces rishiriensis]
MHRRPDTDLAPEQLTVIAGHLEATKQRIDSWLCEYLAGHGWAAEPTFYSKRSLLRDTIALRPDLATP